MMNSRCLLVNNKDHFLVHHPSRIWQPLCLPLGLPFQCTSIVDYKRVPSPLHNFIPMDFQKSFMQVCSMCTTVHNQSPLGPTSAQKRPASLRHKIHTDMKVYLKPLTITAANSDGPKQERVLISLSFLLREEGLLLARPTGEFQQEWLQFQRSCRQVSTTGKCRNSSATFSVVGMNRKLNSAKL